MRSAYLKHICSGNETTLISGKAYNQETIFLRKLTLHLVILIRTKESENSFVEV